MLSFQVETWPDLERDGQEIFKAHYNELALHKDVMPMGLDGAIYLELERLGRLLVITARKDGGLVGYYMAIMVAKHPHNRDGGPVSTTDFFYVLSEHRKGGVGARMLRYAFSELRKRGIVVASISVKWLREKELDWATLKMLVALGCEPTDLVVQIVLNEKAA